MRKPQMVTDRELDILKVLWTRGRASVRQVQSDLNTQEPESPVAYSTVQTLLNIMEERKGLVDHTVEGRTFVYKPIHPSQATIRDLTTRFVDRVFDGDLARALTALIQANCPTPEQVSQLHQALDHAQSTCCQDDGADTGTSNYEAINGNGLNGNGTHAGPISSSEASPGPIAHGTT